MIGGFEGEANEGVGFLESLIDVSPVLGMADVNVGDQAFGYELQLMPDAFHQHATMTLDFFDSLIDLIESAVNPFESLVDALEAPI